MAERPGFMIYFDIAPALSKLTDEEAGKLFKAIMDYATSGNVHELDGICGFAFEVIRPRIDRDKEAYEEKCRKSSYSTYVRECKKRDEQAMSYEKWLESLSNDIERYHTTSNVNERYPTQHNSTQLQQQLNSNTTTTTTTTENNNKGKGATDASDPDPVAAVLSDYLNRINPTASPSSLEELRSYAEDMGKDVCIRAFDIALDNKKTTWPYIRAILRDKLQRGVKCLADWDALETEREKSKKEGGDDENRAGNFSAGEKYGVYL